GHQSSVYLKLAGRCLSEPAENFSGAIAEIFEEIIARVIPLVAESLPHLDERDIFWRMHLSMGTMVHALTGEDKLVMISQGRVVPGDPEDTLRELINFTAAGLRAGKTKKKRPANGGALAAAALSVLVLSGCKSLSPKD